MLAKLTKPLQALTQLTTRHSQQDTATTAGASIMNRNCPCCSDTLLRHIRSGGLYWRCRSCHQEMPVEDASLECN